MRMTLLKIGISPTIRNGHRLWDSRVTSHVPWWKQGTTVHCYGHPYHIGHPYDRHRNPLENALNIPIPLSGKTSHLLTMAHETVPLYIRYSKNKIQKIPIFNEKNYGFLQIFPETNPLRYPTSAIPGPCPGWRASCKGVQPSGSWWISRGFWRFPLR
jgi:hypothetical protein